MDRTTLHFIGGESRARAEQARIAFALGHHAEVYSELDELFERPPFEGIVIAADDGPAHTVEDLIGQLGERGIWLPVVIAAAQPAVERVVAAIKAGALDFLELPLEMGSFARRLEAIVADAGHYAERRRREVEAQHAVAHLSRREREVLELLSAGCSNKEIARTLEISPRTVEIHRGNMMTKLGAGHAADAVRLWIDAQPELLGWGDRAHETEAGAGVVAVRLGERRAGLPPVLRRGQRQ
jgi:two-component system, LuxR family, response regulator FixJ